MNCDVDVLVDFVVEDPFEEQEQHWEHYHNDIHETEFYMILVSFLVVKVMIFLMNDQVVVLLSHLNSMMYRNKFVDEKRCLLYTFVQRFELSVPMIEAV